MTLKSVYREADFLALPVPAGTLSGDARLVGDIPVHCQTDRDADGEASCALKGAFDMEVEASGGALAVGDPVYIDGATFALTNDAGHLYGFALAAIPDTDTATIPVRLAGPNTVTQA